MRVCANCGEPNPPEAEFCGNCGEFVAWRDAPADERVLATTQGPAVEQPTVQKPAEQQERRRPAPVLTEPKPPSPGDLICGQCGVGNAPERKFCRHCGHSLAEAEVVRPCWWQRLIPQRRRRRRHVGDRPRARGGRPWRTVARFVTWLLVILLAAGGLLYAAVPSVRTDVNREAKSFKTWVTSPFSTRYTQVRALETTATSQVPGHEAKFATDSGKNTFWAAPVPGPEPVLVLRFDRPVDIRQVIVRGGNPADIDSTHRPAKLHLVYSTGRAADLSLADTPEPQTLGVGEVAGATTVEIHITALHRSQSATSVALSEIELFEKAS